MLLQQNYVKHTKKIQVPAPAAGTEKSELPSSWRFLVGRVSQISELEVSFLERFLRTNFLNLQNY